jgi:uncharacterized repeat protein (TIGR01451 family)
MVHHSVRRPSLIMLFGMVGVLAAFALGMRSALPPVALTRSAPSDGPSTITDAQGRFRFEGLNHSSHLLRVDVRTLPAEVRPAHSAPVLTLSPGVTQVREVAPGVVLRATYHDTGSVLDGVVFRDRDGDGLQGPDEPGLPGVQVIDPDFYQYFVPFNDNNLYQSFADVLGPACLNDPNVSTTIASTIAMTPSSNGTTIYYDHWEDGYDPDPTTPGPTTLVLPNLAAGQVQTWQNNLPIPRTAANLLFDGRDRITIVGQPAQAVRAAWLTNPGARLAGAWEMAKVSDWGRRYIIPIGEDIGQRGPQSFGDYDYVSIEVMAAYDGTVVQIDTNADGIFDLVRTISAGETAYVRGSANQQGFAIVSGAEVQATLPVQVQVRAGNCRAPYSGRSYSLVPVERWFNEYWSPVSSFFTGANNCTVRYLPPQNNRNLSADVDIYIYNPSTAPLPVTYQDISGSGTITIPPRATGSYLKLRFPTGTPGPGSISRSNTYGVHLTAPGPFSAVTAVDTTSLGNNGADFDWSYTLVPARDLSSRVVLSWAPGSAASNLRSVVNGSTAYAQATQDGTLVFADLNGDGTPDQFDTDGDGVLEASSAYGYNELASNTGILLNRGQMVRVSDPSDHDMTGAIISSQDNDHRLAVVYGEDACIAGPQNPFLDLGYTVLPLPIPELSKSAKLVIDADRSGDVSPGDTLEYTVLAYNNGVGPIENPVITDLLPYTYTSFLIGSIASVPAPLTPPGVLYDDGSGTFTYAPSGAPGTPDPLIHAFRANYATLAPGASIVITFRVQLHAQIPPEVRSFDNFVLLTSSNTPSKTAQVTTPINQVDLSIHKTDGRDVVQPLDQITYTITYTNAGPGIAYNVVMTDTLPPTAINVSSPTIPGVITPTIEPGRIIFQLGTLQPGQVGQTTVTLTLAPGTPAGDVVNTVVISTSSHEPNTGNNSSTDIDRIPGPTAVVLAELRADRVAGGVLVRWRTVAEQDNYGFHVYRSTTPNRAAAVRVTPALIPGQGRGLAGGASYSFLDAGAPDGPVYYWLEAIDFNGTSAFYGPARATLQGAPFTLFLPIAAR